MLATIRHKPSPRGLLGGYSGGLTDSGRAMASKITKRLVDMVGPGSTKDAFWWDSELRGFGLKVTPTGVKVYVLQYHVGTGRNARRRRLVIGRHGSPWTPETARAEAKRLSGEVAKGFDPLERRQQDRNTITVAELCDLYLAEGVAHKKATTLRSDRARIRHHIKPLLGKRRIDQVTRADVERVLMDVKAGKTAVEPEKDKRQVGSMPRGGVGAAGQCVTLLGTLFTFAMQRGLRADNPAHGVKKPPVRKMQRFLSEQEITRLAAALDAEASASGNTFPAAAIKLLLFTGCRRSEITGLEWRHVDFERGREGLRLPDSKTGERTVHLNAPALVVLGELPHIEGNPFVIAGRRDGAAFGGIDKVWSRVRKAAGLDGVRLHDLRHSFASVAAAGGFSLQMIGAMLGHKHAATTSIYAHLSADPVRAANEAVGARIAAAMTRHTNDGAVVDLPSRKA
jgi:integrase